MEALGHYFHYIVAILYQDGYTEQGAGMKDSRKLMQTVHESIASIVTTDVSGVPEWEFLCCKLMISIQG
jgi:hypothetical protein